MIRVKKVDDSHKQQVLKNLRQDPLKHAFALHYLLCETNGGIMYGAFDDKNRLKGYLLTRKTPTRQSVILEADEKSGKKLLEHMLDNDMTIIASADVLPQLEKRFPNKKPYRLDWFALRRGEAHFFTSSVARSLKPSDADQLANLFRTSLVDGLKDILTLKKVKKMKEIPSLFLARFKTGLRWFASRNERAREWTERATAYGIFIDSKLVSIMEAKVQTPEVWVIGGAFTHPAFRGRGFATLVLSAIVKEALRSAEYATAFVRSDNESAIRLFKKIGFGKVGERVGVDIGTGFSL